MKNHIRLVLPALMMYIISSSAHSGTYNGPSDPNAYAEPKDVMCYGIPSYPSGANLTFSPGYVGNLEDGFSYAHTAGQVGILYFQYMAKTGNNLLQGNVTSINTLNDFSIEFKDVEVRCEVKSWY